MRKTASVRDIMERANARQLSYEITKEQRAAIFYFTEAIAMDTGNYNGYQTVDVTPEGVVTHCGPSSFGVEYVTRSNADGTTYTTWEDEGYRRWREHAVTSSAHRMQFILPRV